VTHPQKTHRCRLRWIAMALAAVATLSSCQSAGREKIHPPAVTESGDKMEVQYAAGLRLSGTTVASRSFIVTAPQLEGCS